MATLRACTPPDLVDFLNSGEPFFRANLLTLTLVSGLVIRATDYDHIPVVSGTLGTFADDLMFSRSSITHRKGVEVDSMELVIYPRASNFGTSEQQVALAASGALDFAKVQLDVAIFTAAAPTTLRGTFNWFTGKVADISDLSAARIALSVKTELSRLDIMMPRNLIQPGCLNTLFDQGCGLLETAWRSTGTVTSVNADGSLNTTLSNPTGYLDGGRLVVTSGDNAQVVRKIKNNVAGVLHLFAPLVFPVTAGTTIRVNPGCPKTKDVCASKFSNGARFRGFPYVPTPETIL